MPTVSIIIPVHNPGPFLREALRSVHEQTFEDWELLLVDDNSSEDLSWVTREFPRAILIRQAHGGASVARNNGILNSTGTFIAFMDQDDLWQTRKLERQVAALHAQPDSAVCFCDLQLIDADGKPLSADGGDGGGRGGTSAEPIVELDNSGPPKSPGTSKLCASVRYFSSRFVVPSTVMLRRSCLAISGLLDPFIPFSGDYDLLIKLGAKYKVIRIPATDVLYRKHANNFSDRYQVGRREVEVLVYKYRALARAQGDVELEKNAAKLFRRPSSMYAAQAFDCARRSYRQRQFKSLAYHLACAFWFSPLFVLGSISRWRGVRRA
jgi:glycosyltransferase involved in cell wall biosynthesis